MKNLLQRTFMLLASIALTVNVFGFKLGYSFETGATSISNKSLVELKKNVKLSHSAVYFSVNEEQASEPYEIEDLDDTDSFLFLTSKSLSLHFGYFTNDKLVKYPLCGPETTHTLPLFILLENFRL